MSPVAGSSTARPLAGHAPVVVLNMHYSGLGIARNLAPLGVTVFGLSPEPGFPGDSSRHCHAVRAPDSLREPERLRDLLVRFARERGERCVLFPTRDHDIVFVNRFRRELDEGYVIPFSEPATIDRVMNKDACFDAARAGGNNVPRGLTLGGLADLDAAASLKYPVICKPLYSSQWRKPGIWEAVGGQKAVQIDDFAGLRDFYQRFVELDPVATVQEWIPGPESSLVVFGSYVARSGELQAFFTGRKLLQLPPLVGTGVVVEAVRIPAIEPPSRALLARLGLFGVSEIEYKIDPRDGTPYLIEINPRHWDQHRLGAITGVNLSEAAYRDAVGLPPRPMTQSERPARWFADFDFAVYLARALARGEPFAQTLGWLRGNTTFSIIDRSDLRPTARLVSALARRFAGAAWHRLRSPRQRARGGATT